MVYSKSQFEKDIENLSNNFSKYKIECLLKDLSDCIVFSCIYMGNQNVFFEKIKVEKKNETNFQVVTNLKNVKKENMQDANKYVLNSYDKTLTLTIIVSQNYYMFEKENDTGTYKYKSEYFFDGLGNFIRKTELTHERLNTQQKIDEFSIGNLQNDLYIAETQENVSDLKVLTFKLPSQDNKSENVYFKYETEPNSPFMCRARVKFNKVPYLEVLGMNTLATMLSEQFEDDEEPLRITDKSFFDKLLQTCTQYYKIVKKQEKKAEKK